jgi:hypothetical protein
VFLPNPYLPLLLCTWDSIQSFNINALLAFAAIERQPCPKWTAKVSTVICGASVEQFVTQTATEAKMNDLLLLPYLKCQYPSMTNPATMLDLLGGVRQLPIEWSLNGCQCR